MPTVEKVSNLVKGCDMFGASELLRFKSSATYQTPCGGIATLSLVVFLVAYSCVLGSNVYGPTTVTGQYSLEDYN